MLLLPAWSPLAPPALPEDFSLSFSIDNRSVVEEAEVVSIELDSLPEVLKVMQ